MIIKKLKECLGLTDLKKNNPPLIEKEDYYIENNKYVFTEKYHLKRGNCCGNFCRHCPYDHVNCVED